MPPAVGLIVIAVLNIVVAIYFVISGVVTSNLPDEEFEKEVTAAWTPAQRDMAEKAGYTVALMKRLTLFLGLGAGALGGFLSLLTILGAVRMMSLKSYGLAVLVSVLAAVPCVSFMACCGPGEGVGIWALVVLLNPEVRSAFR
jgi:hypothetical protein